jgi:hypothetical protein
VKEATIVKELCQIVDRKVEIYEKKGLAITAVKGEL